MTAKASRAKAAPRRADGLAELPGGRLVQARVEFDETNQVRGHGKRVRRIYVVDILQKLEMSGRLDPEDKDRARKLRLAGEEFRDDIQRAGLAGIRIAALERIEVPFSAGSDAPTRAEHCKRRVFRDLDALGGANSISAQCLYHVVGLEESLREWATLKGFKSHHYATGVLIAALPVVAKVRGFL